MCWPKMEKTSIYPCTWDAGHAKPSQERSCKDSIIILVIEGKKHKTPSRKYNKLGMLHEAKDWVTDVDVDQQTKLFVYQHKDQI